MDAIENQTPDWWEANGHKMPAAVLVDAIRKLRSENCELRDRVKQLEVKLLVGDTEN
jgi:hypothetical protein